MADRLWFFAVGWSGSTPPIAQVFPRTGVANTETDKNRRGEIKLTGRGARATLQGGYVNNHTEMVNQPVDPDVEHRSVHDRPGQPSEFVLLHELQGRREPDVARRSAIFAAGVDARRGRHEHRCARIAVPEPGRQRSVQRPVLRRE